MPQSDPLLSNPMPGDPAAVRHCRRLLRQRQVGAISEDELAYQLADVMAMAHYQQSPQDCARCLDLLPRELLAQILKRLGAQQPSPPHVAPGPPYDSDRWRSACAAVTVEIAARCGAHEA